MRELSFALALAAVVLNQTTTTLAAPQPKS
jgi:hypothetical protein